MITAKKLVDFSMSWLGKPYMYGNNGQTITEWLIQAKAKQYPTHYDESKIAHLRQFIGQKAVQCNSFTSMLLEQERSANGWLSVAVQRGSSIATLPEIPGITVHLDGHMGVYIGGGKVLEARGTFYGVVVTRILDRPWKSWAKMPGVDYSQGDSEMLKKGDSGTAVKQWQNALILSGFKMISDNGKEYGSDGSFGGATENGTIAFQKAKNILVTGLVDVITFSAMIENLSAMAADRTVQGKLDNCRAIINDVIVILEKGAL